jgi:hypothetical protein
MERGLSSLRVGSCTFVAVTTSTILPGAWDLSKQRKGQGILLSELYRSLLCSLSQN